MCVCLGMHKTETEGERALDGQMETEYLCAN